MCCALYHLSGKPELLEEGPESLDERLLPHVEKLHVLLQDLVVVMFGRSRGSKCTREHTTEQAEKGTPREERAEGRCRGATRAFARVGLCQLQGAKHCKCRGTNAPRGIYARAATIERMLHSCQIGQLRPLSPSAGYLRVEGVFVCGSSAEVLAEHALVQ